MQITAEQLAMVCQSAPESRIALFAPRLSKACEEWGINTSKRVAAFLAQAAHECGEFRWLVEIWGPTAQQLRYDPPGRLAVRLGNTEKGDGRRYCGRGPFMITGKDNYAACSAALFPDDPGLLLQRPELLEQPMQGCRSAGWYWKSRSLDQWADNGQFQTLTRRINGGLNGLEDRVKYWRRALAAFHVAETTPDGGGGDD